MAKTGVLGAGSWGMALAILLADNGHEVTIWTHSQKQYETLCKNHMDESKLPEIALPSQIKITSSLAEVIGEKDIIVLAVPSVAVRETCQKIKTHVKAGQIIVCVSKGIEEATLMLMTEIMEEELPQADAAVLSGPSHAEEVARHLPTTCVAGARSAKTAEYLQKIFSSPVFRVYTSSDRVGIELGGALKNVIALAAGMADGLGYGDNTKAALITRGIAEISRLGMAMGGRAESFYGLTGMGDLIVTCASRHSRNRRAGVLIGKGYSFEEAMKEVKMVVEGVYSAKAAKKLADQYQIEMPIVDQVNRILFEKQSAKQAVRELMDRDYRAESEFL